MAIHPVRCSPVRMQLICLKRSLTLTSKNFAIKEIIECTREYVRPMSTEALSRIYSGLNEAVHVHVPMTGALQTTPMSQQTSSRRLLHRKSSSMSLGSLSMNMKNSFTMRNNMTKFPRQESCENSCNSYQTRCSR